MQAIDPKTPKFFPKTSRYYYMNVSEIGGCQLRDSIFVEVHKKPIPKLVLNYEPVICPCRQLTMTVSGGDDTYPFTYLWNDGSTALVRDITQAGYYSVTVTNQIGFSRSIDTYITIVTPNISVNPAELTVSTGDTIIYPINLNVNQGIISCGFTNFKIKLSYNKSILVPNVKSGMSINAIDSVEYLEYQGPVLADINKMFEFVATLGSAKCTDVKVEELNFSCDEINYNIKNGKVCLSNVCSEPTDRLFTETNPKLLKQNFPNPAQENTEIEFSLSSTRIYETNYLRCSG